MNVSIRLAASDDIDALLRFDRHIARERLLRAIEDGCVFLVHRDGVCIGIFRYSLFWQTHPFLDLIYLAGECRGKGIGRACMDYWENAMRERGFSHVLTSTQADETAYLFYEKLDYERCGAFYPPEQDAAEYLYRKKL